MNRTKLIQMSSGAVVIGILILFVVGLNLDGTAADVGDDAVSFSLEDREGNLVNLDDHLGEQPIVMTFFSTWCQPCRQQTPEVIAFQEEYGQEVLVLTVVKSETRRAVDRFIDDTGYEEPYYVFDFNSDVSKAYGITGQPETIIINQEGIIVEHVVGGVSRDMLAMRALPE
ncbi:TlpA family protein disulfide reductase [Salisediminibacterium selenitireducens]|uniref:Alkyl hydroperoxide reductase/ Thiol specific antioxidant/ Mal allergen n=1 Tax=Bacillus selenitireducens (strain ATCC 700615 / DSM 15326 / MLS10) TaxID=439292 RepID=D6XSP3_BACIE|nr:TlpA disulfide reductase family protein [Salisediminibacterium selenitireducens]ADH98829.1 alkyl hydroperoxide reductase/ Thiol specific antioxidant/ Mal allergen [[Bacillus] selenitireducens MLS10]